MYKPFVRNAYRNNPRPWIDERYFTIDKFSGGLNNVEPDNLIGDSESTDCMNMRFTDDMIMEKRPGIDIYDNENYGQIEGKITWTDVYRPSLKEPLIVRATNKEIYIGSKKISDVNGTVRGVTYINKYYFVDGNALRVYDINKDKVYRIIREPIEHLEEKTTANTTTIKLKKIPEITKVGDTVIILAASMKTESNYESTVKAIDVENKTITVNASISTELPVDTPIFFYKPKDEKNVVGEEVFDDENGIAYYLPCELEIADSYAGESYMPDSPSVITVHNSRLFIAGDKEQPHGIYMSKTVQPLYFPSAAGLTVKPDGDKIVDLVVFDNALIIGRTNDMYALYGNSEYQDIAKDPYYIKQMDVSCGFMCSKCGALLNNYYIYLGSDGRFYKLNTPTTFVEYLMTSPLPHKCDIYEKPLGIKRNTEVNVYAKAYRNEIYFCINDEFVIVYSYDNMAYTYYKGWLANSITIFDNKLLIGRTDGVLAFYKDDEEFYNDLNKPIECRYETKRYDVTGSLPLKFFKQFSITSYAFDENLSNIHAKVEVDYNEMVLKNPIPSNLSRFDNAQWNLNRFDSTNLFVSWYYQLNIKGRTIKFIFSNNIANEGMRIFDINVLYTIRDIR